MVQYIRASKYFFSLILLMVMSSLTFAQLSYHQDTVHTTCGLNNGRAVITTTGVGYTCGQIWSTGASTDTISNLAAGNYSVTVSCSPTGTSSIDTVYLESFEGAHGYTLNTPTGVNGADNNYWVVNDNEGGVNPGSCGVALNGNKTLHVTSVAFPGGGAAYDAGGLCGILFCPETNMRAESPTISTVGHSGMLLQFDYISMGDGLLDNASVLYSTDGGTIYNILSPSIKSVNCPSGQGLWAFANFVLPAACEGIPNLKIAFNWTNNDDGTGTDPSVAINNVRIIDTSSLSLVTDTFYYTVFGSSPESVSITVSDDTICPNESVTLTASGPAYGTYTWTGGTISGSVSGSSTTDSPNTTVDYFLNWNSGACSARDTARVYVLAVNASINSITQPTCGRNNGRIVSSGTGGSGSYSFDVYNSSGVNVGTGLNLYPGTYGVVVTDNVTGCMSDTVYTTLTDTTNAYVIEDTLITDVSCYGGNDGAISMVVNGGNLPVNYVWAHGPTDSTLSGLTAGTYTLSITDAICTIPQVFTLVVNQPDTSIFASYTLVDDTCLRMVGSAAVAASGGTAPYNFQWSNGNAGASISGLAAGPYYLTITDSSGCVLVDTVNLANIGGPSAGLNQLDSTCPNMSDGYIEIEVYSNDGPHTFAWSHDTTVTTRFAGELAEGTYSVTITNRGNCDTIITIDVPAYNLPIIDVEADTSIHLGESVRLNLVGDFSASSIVWRPDINLVDLTRTVVIHPAFSKYYYADVHLLNGCVVSDSAYVTVDTLIPAFTVPNVFTPNNDGINDYFKIEYNEGIISSELHIFDRWGNEVFTSFDLNPQWDGTSIINGAPLDLGVFAYYLLTQSILSDVRVIRYGNITLIR